MMTLDKPAEKHPYVPGKLSKYKFQFIECAGEFEGLMSAVNQYVKQHLLEKGYDPETVPAATTWFATCAPDKQGKDRVWGVTGMRGIQGGIEVTDFYVNHSKMGVIAAYAAMEELKTRADEGGFRVLTMTPDSNTDMIEAYRRVFGVEAPVRKLDVYLYQGGS